MWFLDGKAVFFCWYDDIFGSVFLFLSWEATSPITYRLLAMQVERKWDILVDSTLKVVLLAIYPFDFPNLPED